ncbi:MAG: NAD(P)-dependent alcohol dehydrogenase [Armatimonadota bacterium]|nr:NAD(P)-dependent alcohol dehydrogenase [Armatimonadota bacterium]
MKAIRLYAPFDLRMHHEPAPDIGSDDVLIRIKSVGICASDVHYYKEGRIGTSVVEKPLILGHEPSGVIEDVGSTVQNLRKGDRVAVEPARPCWECELCRAGHTHVCRGVRFFGTPPIDGALRELIAWPSRLAIPIPDNVSFDEAAMVEPLAIGMHAARVADLKGGETVAVLGAGAIGLSVLQAVRLRNPARVIVTEPIEERRSAAVKLGADAALDPSSPDIVGRIIAANSGREPDVVFECAGEPEAFTQACTVARPLSTVVIVGIPSEDVYCFPASVSRRKELVIRLLRRSCGEAEEAVRMVEEGRVDVKSYVTHTFPLENTREALDLAAAKSDGAIRVVVHVS